MILRVSILTVSLSLGILFVMRAASGSCDWTQYPGQCDRHEGGCGWGWDVVGHWTETRCYPDGGGPPCCLCFIEVWQCKKGAELVTKYNDDRRDTPFGECKKRTAPGGTPMDECLAF